MTLLIAGGDSTTSFSRAAQVWGVQQIVHWSGRKPRDLRRRIPRETRAVVIVLDHISHGLAVKVRREAKRLGIPVLYRGRSGSGLRIGRAAGFLENSAWAGAMPHEPREG